MSVFFDLFKKSDCKRSFDVLKKGDKFHFIAMGGVGQSALAKILIKSGYKVSGSDMNDSKYLKELKNLGAKVFLGHNSDNVPDNCFVVLSSAIKEDNPELIRAKELGLTILHRSDLLRAIMLNYSMTIGFAGTHGKTTTSGLASFLLEKMDEKPAYAVGGIISGLNTNANAHKNSSIFAAELDESDGTIIKYSPKMLIINNLEADHLDFYKNGLSDILDTFEKLILSGENKIKIIANLDDDGVLKLIKRLENTQHIENITGFLAENSCDKINIVQNAAIAKNINFNECGAEFEVIYKNKLLGNVKTSLKGLHNVYNTLAVITALLEAGCDFNDFVRYIPDFTGMGRRFQTVFKDKNLEIIDDYAHHPNEIKATLNAAGEYRIKSGKDRLVAIFQPHRYTRLKALWEEFLECFDDCDMLVVLDVYNAGDKFDPEFNSKNFAKLYKEKHSLKNTCYVEGKVQDIIFELKEKIKIGNSKDIILTLGAGDITKLGRPLGEELTKEV